MRRWSVSRTDVGKKRPHNEDSFYADDKLGLYVVADGVGGHAKGEVASQEAVEQIHGWVKAESARIAEYLANPDDERLGALRRVLESAVQQACYMVYGMAEQDPEQKGMSTTISTLLLAGEVGIIGQVGDSRIYRLRGGVVQQLTEDHTLLNYKLKHGLITPEQAARAPGKNVITRAVGHKDYVEVDTIHVDAAAGDRFLLCSDGLHGYLRDGELDGIIGHEPKSAVDRLIDLANARGGRDNITVVLVLVS
ncbi:MAG: serine/threonine-protein phosphatase [Deltaproteobacteria bacterium]|nr:serine/threonine-protein phosphatase [Deltaproteobacteria bacterium]